MARSAEIVQISSHTTSTTFEATSFRLPWAALVDLLAKISQPASVFTLAGDPVFHNPEARAALEVDPEALTLPVDFIKKAHVAGLTMESTLTGRHEACTVILWKRTTPHLHEQIEACCRDWGLSKRETQVFAHVVQGISNRQIAERLNCGVRTVELHMSGVLGKTGLSSRGELIAGFWQRLYSPQG